MFESQLSSLVQHSARSDWGSAGRRDEGLRPEAAEEHGREVVSAMERVLGETHAFTLIAKGAPRELLSADPSGKFSVGACPFLKLLFSL